MALQLQRMEKKQRQAIYIGRLLMPQDDYLPEGGHEGDDVKGCEPQELRRAKPSQPASAKH